MQTSTAPSQPSRMIASAMARPIRALILASFFAGLFLLSPVLTTPLFSQSNPPTLPRDRRPNRELTVPYHPMRPAPPDVHGARRPSPAPAVIPSRRSLARVPQTPTRDPYRP